MTVKQEIYDALIPVEKSTPDLPEEWESKGAEKYRQSQEVLGFDLEKATTHLVGKSLSISLPSAELVNYKIDSTWEPIEEQYTRLVSHTTYNRYRDEAETEAQEKLKAKALDPQITRIATDQAKLLIRNFYEINFPELTVSFSTAKDSNQ